MNQQNKIWNSYFHQLYSNLSKIFFLSERNIGMNKIIYRNHRYEFKNNFHNIILFGIDEDLRS